MYIIGRRKGMDIFSWVTGWTGFKKVNREEMVKKLYRVKILR